MESEKDVPLSLFDINTIDQSICLVCGDQNAKINYSVRSCGSCKIFFRRYAHLDLNNNQCKFGRECFITKMNRHECRYCRLKKCLSIGMKKDLLRSPHGSQKQKEINSIHPFDLFYKNSSLLTVNEWSSISYIKNSYDNHTSLGYIRYIISNQFNYPPKIRLKIANSNLMNIIQSMYFTIESFIKTIPEFSSMNINQKFYLIKRNLRNLGNFNCIFLMKEIDILQDFAYSNSLSFIYGSIFHLPIQMIQQIDIDQNLIKFFIVIMLFSTSSDMIYFEYNQNQRDISNSINHILINTEYFYKIQNIYIEIMFKYMLYRYGYDQAVLHFHQLIKTFLFQSLLTININQISKHEFMFQTVMKKAEQSLIIQEEEFHN